MTKAAPQEFTCRNCHYTFVPSFLFDFYPDSKNPKTGLCENCMMAEAFSTSRPSRDPVPLPAGYKENVCKFGKGRVTCSFLGITTDGLHCLKNSSFESAIRQRRQENSMRAKGDNCSGPPDFQKL